MKEGNVQLFFVHKNNEIDKESTIITWKVDADLNSVQSNIHNRAVKLAQSIITSTELTLQNLVLSQSHTVQETVDYNLLIENQLKSIYISLKNDITVKKSFFLPKLFNFGAAQGMRQGSYINTQKDNYSDTVYREISLEELAKHNKHDDCWVALNGVVYDITVYLDYHPGGGEILLKHSGKDVSDLFYKFHPWVNYSLILEKNKVGFIKLQKTMLDAHHTAE